MLDVFLAVPGGFKNSSSKPDSSILRCSLFQVVALGYCQTTVNLHLLWLLRSTTELYFGQVVFGQVVQTAPDGRFRQRGRGRRVVLGNLASGLPSFSATGLLALPILGGWLRSLLLRWGTQELTPWWTYTLRP